MRNKEERKPFMTRLFGHLKTVLTHKRWVLFYASRLGITWQGITHDLSKFSPVEFLESVRYWTGTRSPITKAKEDIGISYAWLHHKGRNRHHYEYWVDYFERGGIPHKIPFKYVLEMVSDWLAACRTYSGQSEEVFKREYDWWLDRCDRLMIHNETKALITDILHTLALLSMTEGSDARTLRLLRRHHHLKDLKEFYEEDTKDSE